MGGTFSKGEQRLYDTSSLLGVKIYSPPPELETVQEIKPILTERDITNQFNISNQNFGDDVLKDYQNHQLFNEKQISYSLKNNLINKDFLKKQNIQDKKIKENKQLYYNNIELTKKKFNENKDLGNINRYLLILIIFLFIISIFSGLMFLKKNNTLKIPFSKKLKSEIVK